MGIGDWLLGDYRPCCFCGKSGGTTTVTKSWAYISINHTYHEACRQRVLNDPEKYGNSVIDIACEIEECLAYNKRERDRRLERAHKAADSSWGNGQ